MKEIIMPKMGFTMTESTIVQWIKREGDAVQKGEPIAEVTTDKVNMEVEAPESGTLAGLKYSEGDTVPVTEVIAYVLEAGEKMPGAEERRSGGAEERKPSASPNLHVSAVEFPTNATPVAMRVAQERGVDLAAVKGTGTGGRITREDVERIATPSPLEGEGRGEGVRATPNARRLAGELSINLNDVNGSGPNGRVQGDDVVAEAGVQMSRGAEKKVGAVSPALSLPYAGMRKTIGTRLQHSYQTAPHVTFGVDVDVTSAEALRMRANAKIDAQAKLPGNSPRPQPLPGGEGSSIRVSLTAILAKACAWALLRHPMMNARLNVNVNQIVLNDAAHIGIAVALADGLIVPVVRDVQAKGLLRLASDIADLAARAKTNKLKPDEMGNGTFTISNLGMFGVDRFTAIINPPETAILAVGRVRKMFVPDANDQPVLRPIMTLTLSADHRVIDGAVAAQFMSDLRDAIEQPDTLLL